MVPLTQAPKPVTHVKPVARWQQAKYLWIPATTLNTGAYGPNTSAHLPHHSLVYPLFHSLVYPLLFDQLLVLNC